MTHRTMTTHKRLLSLAIATTASLGSLPMTAQAQSETGMKLDPVVVSATRSETSVSETARSVTVINEEEIDKQAKLTRNLSEILANTVPGFGESTESISNFGQPLRGRNFLVLIDGIPQSTLLRNTYRGLNTISTSAIERIEVIRGGTSIYGFGGNGGVINILTKKASEQNASGYSEVGARFSTEHFDDSIDLETEHRVSGTQGSWDYLLSGSFVERGGRFDEEGDRIPPNGWGGQGGFSDTTEYNALVKLGYEFDAGKQRLELMANEFRNVQDTEFTFGTPANDGKVPAIPFNESVSSARPVKDPEQLNRNVRLSYQNRDIAGQTVDSTLYYADYNHVFPKYPGFPQTDVEGDRWGLRASVNTPLGQFISGSAVTWGVDYIHDSADERTWTQASGAASGGPELEQDAIAAFGELEIPLSDSVLARFGVRQEHVELDMGGVASNNNGNRITPGTLEYNETLLNAGLVYFVTDRAELFANFSQGFTISDISRDINDAGSDSGGEVIPASEFESDAEKVDNYEIGARYSGGDLSLTGAVFYSESNGGITYTPDLEIQRSPDEVWGAEMTADYALTDFIETGGNLTWTEGVREVDGGSERLSADRISPLMANLFMEENHLGWMSNRLQARYVGDRDRAGENTNYPLNVESYTTIDYVGQASLGPGQLSISVNNLLNEGYFPMMSQAAGGVSKYRGQGRTVGVGYSVNW